MKITGRELVMKRHDDVLKRQRGKDQSGGAVEIGVPPEKKEYYRRRETTLLFQWA